MHVHERRLRGRHARVCGAQAVRPRGGPSKFRGVVWHKSNSKWEARIYEAGKQRFLGYFTSETEAARVYDEAARRIGGRTAKVGIPRLQ